MEQGLSKVGQPLTPRGGTGHSGLEGWPRLVGAGAVSVDGSHLSASPLSSTTGARATFHLPTLGQTPERRGGIMGGAGQLPEPTGSPALAASPRGTQPPGTPEPHSSRMSPLTAWKLQGVWPGARACRRKLWAVAVASPLGGGVSAPGASSLQAEPQARKARHSHHEPPLAPSLGGHRSAARCWLGAPSPCSA